MVDLNPNHLKTVKLILAEHVSGCEVRAFGSRVKARSRNFIGRWANSIGECDNWNENPRPFIWHKTSDQIITLAGYLQ